MILTYNKELKKEINNILKGKNNRKPTKNQPTRMSMNTFVSAAGEKMNPIRAGLLRKQELLELNRRIVQLQLEELDEKERSGSIPTTPVKKETSAPVKKETSAAVKKGVSFKAALVDSPPTEGGAARVPKAVVEAKGEVEAPKVVECFWCHEKDGHIVKDCPLLAQEVCRFCKKTGHTMSHCPTKAELECGWCHKNGHTADHCEDLASMTCHNCSEKGHISSRCPHPRKAPQQKAPQQKAPQQKAKQQKATEKKAPAEGPRERFKLTVKYAGTMRDFVDDALVRNAKARRAKAEPEAEPAKAEPEAEPEDEAAKA